MVGPGQRSLFGYKKATFFQRLKCHFKLKKGKKGKRKKEKGKRKKEKGKRKKGKRKDKRKSNVWVYLVKLRHHDIILFMM